TLLQQLQQPPWRDVVGHLPRPERRCLSFTHDLSERVSTGPIVFDCDNLDGFTVIGIIGGKETGGFAYPSFAGENISVHPPATKAIPQRSVCRCLCIVIWPTRRNVETLTVGHTLKSRVDRSGALEFGTDAPQCVVPVVVERGSFQLP